MGLPAPSYQDDLCALYQGDALQLMPELPAASVALIIADVPYMGIKTSYLGKRLEWDRQWPTREAYLSWLRQMACEWRRVLAPNGSLYCFAAPAMAAHVEVLLEELFTVLNRITWLKEDGWHQKAEKETLRSYLSPWEAILFCEQRQADAMALGESGYASQCEDLHGHVFEPIRAYLAGERDRAGMTTRQVAEAFQRKTGSRTVTGMAGHWLDTVQWELPTAENYQWLQHLFNTQGRSPAPPFVAYHPINSAFAQFHQAPADEYLRADYESLRADYESLRRPFTVTPRMPYTDIWSFATVPYQPGKHPAEKPLALMRHLIEVSSRPGDLILDPTCGSGPTLEAARQCGRRAIGFELEASSITLARQRLCQQSLRWE